MLKTFPMFLPIEEVQETQLSTFSESIRIQGSMLIEHICQVHGAFNGEIKGKKGSTLILNETGVIEGNIDGDTVIINGYVDGNITAKTRVLISRTGRLRGNIDTPSLTLEFGSYFEGNCTMKSHET